MNDPTPLVRRHAEGLEFMVYVRPGGHRDGLDGRHDGALAVRVVAVAEKGRANRAVERLLARAFAVAPSRVSVVAGNRARRKRVFIMGDPDALEARWLHLVADTS